MLAEIQEQPDVLVELCRRSRASWPRLSSTSGLTVFGSGSSFNAALLAQAYFESSADVMTRVSFASEAFRDSMAPPPGHASVALSHSGGSTDVLEALERAKRRGIRTLLITNLEDTEAEAVADETLVTGAGVERAIPSTKGFIALVAASLLLSTERSDALVLEAAEHLREWLKEPSAPPEILDAVASARVVVFLGNGLLYPVARDGALKLLETTSIPAFAYPVEEFLHGPIALAGPDVVVIAVGGATSSKAVDAARGAGARVFTWPDAPSHMRANTPLTTIVPLQILAHGVGAKLGLDVDAPRHLTKVVRS